MGRAAWHILTLVIPKEMWWSFGFAYKILPVFR